MQKKRKRRRRPRTAGPKLSGVILFRCTKEERLEFRRAAAIAKKTLSAYMLDLFRTAEQNARDFAAMRVRLDNLEKETKEQEAEAAKTHERHSKWESEQKQWLQNLADETRYSLRRIVELLEPPKAEEPEQNDPPAETEGGENKGGVLPWPRTS